MKDFDDKEVARLLKLFENDLKLEKEKCYSKKLCKYFHQYAGYKAILRFFDPIKDGIKEDVVKMKNELQSMYSKLSEEDKLLAALEGAVPDDLG